MPLARLRERVASLAAEALSQDETLPGLRAGEPPRFGIRLKPAWRRRFSPCKTSTSPSAARRCSKARSLPIGERERVCLVGRNGSGKSTLLKIAAGIVEADRGTRFAQPGATIRYLPQEPDLSGFRHRRSPMWRRALRRATTRIARAICWSSSA